MPIRLASVPSYTFESKRTASRCLDRSIRT